MYLWWMFMTLLWALFWWCICSWVIHSPAGNFSKLFCSLVYTGAGLFISSFSESLPRVERYLLTSPQEMPFNVYVLSWRLYVNHLLTSYNSIELMIQNILSPFPFHLKYLLLYLLMLGLQGPTHLMLLTFKSRQWKCYIKRKQLPGWILWYYPLCRKAVIGYKNLRSCPMLVSILHYCHHPSWLCLLPA